MDQKFPLALVGLGFIGKVHADVVTEGNLGFDLVAIHKRTPARYKSVAFYQDMQQMLSYPEISAVSITTPPSSHYLLAKQALQAKKHVLLEKPPTIRISEIQELAALAERNKVTLFMSYHARYHQVIEEIRKRLKGKQVTKVKIIYKEYVFNYHKSDSWVFDPEVSGGGVLMDSGINAISIVTSILPGLAILPTKAEFDIKSGDKVETAARVEFNIGDNSKGVLLMDWLSPEEETRRIELNTSENISYSFDIVEGCLTENDNKIFSEPFKDDFQRSEYRGVYEDFYQHLTENKSLISLNELKFVKDAYNLQRLYSDLE
jgi:predicted dehydrogenase